MDKHTFIVPHDHTLKEVLAFAGLLSNYSGSAQEVIFDFQAAQGYATPFGMLYIGYAIQQFIQAHPDLNVLAVNLENHYYVAHMGYFQHCGFDAGKLPGEAKGSDRYLPITILTVAELNREAGQQGKEVGEVIEERSRHLAQVLTQQCEGPLIDMLTYTLREVIRNVVEHSQSKDLAYCAQYQPSKKRAELAILDRGMGIRRSLSSNPYLKIQDDHEALNLALMPGISSKMYKGIKKRDYDVWQNSGYGLFAVSRLCGHEGKFLICSGDTALSLKPEKKEYLDASFQGVALRLNLCTKSIATLRSTLARIMKEGDQLAKQLNTSDVQASTASKMLSAEFHKVEKLTKPPERRTKDQ